MHKYVFGGIQQVREAKVNTEVRVQEGGTEIAIIMKHLLVHSYQHQLGTMPFYCNAT